MAWRYMKDNHGSSRPRRIIFFDTETIQSPDPYDASRVYNKLRLGVAVYGRYDDGQLTCTKECVFFTPDGFWQFVAEQQSPRDTLWIFAHSLIFDLRITLFEELFEQAIYIPDAPRSRRKRDEHGVPTDEGRPLVVLDNPPTIIGMRHVATQSRVVCLDSFNWFKDSIESLGERCGTPKLQMPIDSNDEWRWLKYCRRDVSILQQSVCMLLKWCDDHNCGVFRYSAAGQAMSAFRHAHKRHKIVLHDDMQCKKLERDSYYGGQSDIFRIGQYSGKYYQLDCTSLYPSVMIGGQYPVKLLHYEHDNRTPLLPPDIDYACSIAEVTLCTPHDTYPMRPDKRTIYCTGDYDTVLSGVELAAAVESGLITKWHRWATYECGTIFNSYVSYFWQLRQQYQQCGDKVLESFCKMMLNSLYGKFGQLSPQWADCPNVIASEPWDTWAETNIVTGEQEHYRSIGWHVQRKGNRTEMKSSFPAISSMVTSAGRMRMRQLRAIAGQDNIYYQAVDSLIVNELGYQMLDEAEEIQPATLGKMRPVRESSNICILGIGDYRVGEHDILIGRKRNAVHNDDGSWTQSQFDGVDSLFKGVRRMPLSIQQVTKHRIKSYINGTQMDDGRIIPTHIDDAWHKCHAN